MTYYKTCESCGANLDPGETCDCEFLPRYIRNPKCGKGKWINKREEKEKIEECRRKIHEMLRPDGE